MNSCLKILILGAMTLTVFIVIYCLRRITYVYDEEDDTRLMFDMYDIPCLLIPLTIAIIVGMLTCTRKNYVHHPSSDFVSTLEESFPYSKSVSIDTPFMIGTPLNDGRVRAYSGNTSTPVSSQQPLTVPSSFPSSSGSSQRVSSSPSELSSSSLDLQSLDPSALQQP